MNESDVIHKFAEMRNHFGDHFPRFASWPKIVLWFREVTRWTLKGDRWSFCKGLSIPTSEFGFVVIRFKLTTRPCAKDDDHVFGFGGKV